MTLQQRLKEAQPLFAEIWQALHSALERVGFDKDLAVTGTPSSYAELRKDPFDHSQTLYAEWRTPHGCLLGSILIHGDGQAFAEFDVLMPHPRKPDWVIEAATAWGRSGSLKSELRLLPALES